MRKLFVALIASAAFVAPAQAAVVFADNFDSYNPASAVPWNGNGVWTTNNSVDLVKSGEYNITCAGGSGNCVDLSGDRNGAISKLITLAGGSHTISFDYTGNQLDAFGGPFPPAGFTVTIGTLNAVIGPLANNSSAFAHFVASFTTSGPTTLTFTQNGGDQFRGSIIDNVSISAVPEPASWALMIAGFGLAGAAMRRRTRVSFATA